MVEVNNKGCKDEDEDTGSVYQWSENPYPSGESRSSDPAPCQGFAYRLLCNKEIIYRRDWIHLNGEFHVVSVGTGTEGQVMSVGFESGEEKKFESDQD